MINHARLAKTIAVLALMASNTAFALPTVSMTQSTNKVVTGRNFVSLTATATPTAGTTISKVEFYRISGTTNTLLHTDTAATNNDKKYHYVAWNLPTGAYSYFAKAYDSTGSTSTSTLTVTSLSTPDRDPVGDSLDLTALIAYAKDRGKYKTVSSTDFSTQAASLANPGDVIVLQGASSMGFFGAVFNRNGTSTDPIVYIPANGITFTSGNNSQWKIRGSDIVFAGFKFSNFLTSGSLIVFESPQRGRFTGNTFTNISVGTDNRPIIDLGMNAATGTASSHNRLDHNTMDGNLSVGMRITPPDSLPAATRVTYANGIATTTPYDEYTVAFTNNRFDHNIYRNVAAGTVTDRMPLQIGTGEHMVYKTDTMIDNNQFENILRQGVNSKTTGEAYLYNSFINMASLGISLRSGDYKRVEGNIFRNVGSAVKIVGQNHVVVNNIVSNDLGTGGIRTTEAFLIHKWGSSCSGSATCTCNIAAPFPTPATDPNSSANLSSSCTYYAKTANNTVAFNTVRNVEYSAVELDRKWGGNTSATQKPTGTILKNNIFSNDGVGANTSAILVKDADSSDGSAPNAAIDRNLYYGANFGLVGTNSVQYVLPGLGADFTPNSTSPVLNIGTDITNVTKDYYLRARKVGTASDLGAVERP